MIFFFGLLVFIFGLIIGSFLNVVILRYNTGTTIGGRSYCFSCGKILRWYELVPLLSFLIQLGKCRSCKAKISWQYPLVEFSTGVLFVLTALRFQFEVSSLPTILFYFVIESLLVIITVYDIRHKIIPDGLVYAFALLSLGRMILLYFYPIPFTLHPVPFDFLAGPILFLFPFFFLWFISKGRWMGLGDAKLSLGIGWFLGLAYGVSAIILGFWIGAGVSVLLLLFQKIMRGKTSLISLPGNLTMKSEIPFGPFLILGALLVFFLHFDITGLSNFL
ncbi:MAG: prepilin peptidase [Candidatus Pacebacteria bacterium]|nr:prepilin peptidase [Candidatus Paceibacterota bacterium]MDD5357094.1 prepilin peptidase [Candidatus Paceibacterota bacterium]